MDNPVPNQLSTEAMGQFRLGIDLLLSSWPPLQIAIQNERGGPDSRQIAEQFPADIVSCFRQAREPIYILQHVEQTLLDSMLSLNTEMEDGSVEEIAWKIMVMHQGCLVGNFTSIERLKEAAPPHITQGLNDGEDEEKMWPFVWTKELGFIEA